MQHYRRNRVAGGAYFFTVNLLDRRSDLLVAEIAALRDAVPETLQLRPFHIDAWVTLPDHLHCLWTLPPGDAEFPQRWQMIKARFSRRVAHPGFRRASLVRKREAGVWQRRYWEHTIRDDGDYAAHMDYIHFNPVKHGLAEHPGAWPFQASGAAWRKGCTPRLGWGRMSVWPLPASGRTERSASAHERAGGGPKPTLRQRPSHLGTGSTRRVGFSPPSRRAACHDGGLKPTLRQRATSASVARVARVGWASAHRLDGPHATVAG